MFLTPLLVGTHRHFFGDTKDVADFEESIGAISNNAWVFGHTDECQYIITIASLKTNLGLTKRQSQNTVFRNMGCNAGVKGLAIHE
jgi:hypothetical protein